MIFGFCTNSNANGLLFLLLIRFMGIPIYHSSVLDSVRFVSSLSYQACKYTGTHTLHSCVWESASEYNLTICKACKYTGTHTTQSYIGRGCDAKHGDSNSPDSGDLATSMNYTRTTRPCIGCVLICV